MSLKIPFLNEIHQNLLGCHDNLSMANKHDEGNRMLLTSK